jgi:hypothetical protein
MALSDVDRRCRSRGGAEDEPAAAPAGGVRHAADHRHGAPPKGGEIRRVEGAVGAASGLTIPDRKADLCIWRGERGAGLTGLL